MFPTTNQINAKASNEFRALAARALNLRRPSGSGGGPAVAANRARPALTKVPAVSRKACTMPQARYCRRAVTEQTLFSEKYVKTTMTAMICGKLTRQEQ